MVSDNIIYSSNELVLHLVIQVVVHIVVGVAEHRIEECAEVCVPFKYMLILIQEPI